MYIYIYIINTYIYIYTYIYNINILCIFLYLDRLHLLHDFQVSFLLACQAVVRQEFFGLLLLGPKQGKLQPLIRPWKLVKITYLANRPTPYLAR